MMSQCNDTSLLFAVVCTLVVVNIVVIFFTKNNLGCCFRFCNKLLEIDNRLFAQKRLAHDARWHKSGR